MPARMDSPPAPSEAFTGLGAAAGRGGWGTAANQDGMSSGQDQVQEPCHSHKWKTSPQEDPSREEDAAVAGLPLTSFSHSSPEHSLNLTPVPDQPTRIKGPTVVVGIPAWGAEALLMSQDSPPEEDGGGQEDGRAEEVGAAVLAGCKTPPVFQSGKEGLDFGRLRSSLL